MSTKSNQHKIAIWGVPPPPIGGMQVHIKRLSQKLEVEGIPYTLYNFTDYRRNNPLVKENKNAPLWYLSLLFFKSPKIHYVITTRAFVRFLAAILVVFRNKKVVLRVGGKSLKDGLEGSWFSRFMTKFALRHCSAFIGVNKDICSLANQHLPQKNANHIPGFITPIDGGELPPQEILSFLGDSDLKIVVSGQVYNREKFDIYGIWDVFEAVKKLSKIIPSLRLVLFAYSVAHDETLAMKDLHTAIKEAKLEKNILIYQSQVNLWPALKVADIFLRPSYTDGDANSLREALSLGTYSIASDCVPRPTDASLYKTGDIKELSDSIINYYNNKNTIEVQADITDNSVKIISLIKSLM